MRDDSRKNKEVIKYLNKENKYTEFWFKSKKVNTGEIFKYYKKAIPSFEEGIKIKIDEFEYYSTSSLSQEYRKYYRIQNKSKKLLLDVNKLAKNKKYLIFQRFFHQEIIDILLMEKISQEEENFLS